MTTRTLETGHQDSDGVFLHDLRAPSFRLFCGEGGIARPPENEIDRSAFLAQKCAHFCILFLPDLPP